MFWQGISHISSELVRKIIGLTDTSQSLDLFEYLCTGDTKASLRKFQELYENGISIDELAKSLMKFSYNLALVKSEFNNGHDFLDIKSIERLKILSAKFEMDFIIRFWEVMQKYLNELSDTFDEKQCFEMIIMRICYISLTPTPFEALLKKESNSSDFVRLKKNVENSKEQNGIGKESNIDLQNNNLALKKESDPLTLKKSTDSELDKFSKLVEFLEEKSEMLISYHLRNSFRLVKFSDIDENRSACHIELENIGDDEEAKSILWKASKILEQITKKKMDIISY